MNTPIRTRFSILAASGLVLAMLILSTSNVLAQKAGRYRLTLTNRTVVEGELKEVEAGYEVKTRQGAIVTVKRSQVVKMEELDPPAGSKPGASGASKSGAKPVPGVGPATGKSPAKPDSPGKPEKSEAPPKPADQPDPGELAEPAGSENTPAEEEITDAAIEAIIGPDAVEPDAVSDSDIQDTRPLPVNQPSVDQMMRIASTAGQTPSIWETDHFVLVYTSPKDVARELGSRLEAIYNWCHTFMRMMDIPAVRPAYKLEIYFFNTSEEYKAYGNNVGGVPEWAAGFYTRHNNRSAFYDLNDMPNIAQFKEQLKRAHWRRRQYFGNLIKRRMDFYNMTVIQHEAAHHIHFNIGLFNPRGDTPHWLIEGLAQMFELPPGKWGGSLGATNHFRLDEFHDQYKRNRKAVVKTRLFVADDAQWGPDKYPHGWALVHFLYKQKRNQFGEYMRKISQREDDIELTPTQKQQEFEDIFGVTDADKFHEEFLNYVFSLRPKWTALE